MILEHGYASKSAEIFKVGLDALKKAFGSNPQATKFLDMQEKRLKELEGGESK